MLKDIQVCFTEYSIMLFRQDDLKKIIAGHMTVAFRCWKKPTVKKGSLVTTSLGRIEILDIKPVALGEISSADVHKAGYQTRQQLSDVLQKQAPGTIYKISLAYHSPDPRIKLRGNHQLSEMELGNIIKGLQRLDHYAKNGPWTQRIMEAIQRHPRMSAASLSQITGDEKDWFKLQVRKLKNKGLTISHGIGYSLSPRGRVVLEALRKNP